MYFVNPFYQSQKLTAALKQKKSQEIQSILTIPKFQRNNEDKRKIYEHFIDSPQLKEIERAKSLKARILCTAQIELISNQKYQKSSQEVQQTQGNQKQNHQKKHQKNEVSNYYIILQKFPQNSMLAVLKKQTKQGIIKQSESIIKQKMDTLRKYSLIKNFQYHELLYLAHFLQKVPDVAYKQFVFKQNQNVNYVYFIQQGEFLVFKDLHLEKEKSVKKLAQNKSKPTLQNTLQFIDETPFRKKQTKLKKEEISRIMGGFGQSFGEMELFLQSRTRIYSLKCNSSASSVYKIHFKYFQQVFEENLSLFKKIQKQYLKKQQNNQQRAKQNLKIKNTFSFSEQNASSLQKQFSLENQKVFSIIFQMDNKDSLKNSHLEGSFTLPMNSPTILVNESNAVKNLARSRKLYSQNAKKIKNDRYNERVSSQLNHSKNNSIKPQSQFNFFPVISKIAQKAKESPDFRLPTIMKKSKQLKKKRGLMDVSTIVSEKQQLFKSISEVQNPQFSFYKLDEKHAKKLNFRRAQLQKSHEEENSLAHSENFIKNLIKRSLKKSGYLVQNGKRQENNVFFQKMGRSGTQSIVNSSSFSVFQQTVNIFPEGNNKTKKLQVSQQINGKLMSNGFDKFFYRI